MTDKGADASMYTDVFRVPPMTDRTKSFKPPPKAFSSGAKFAAGSERPKQYRPRSAHRDLNSSTEFFADTEAARAYRAFERDEINNSRARIRRLGSTHGRVDPANQTQFAKETTVNHDYVSHPFSKAAQIVPAGGNIEMGDGTRDLGTNYAADYAPIVGAKRQEPLKPKYTPKPQVSYQAPQFSVSRQAYVNHGAITRPKDYAPENSYRPSSSPAQKDTESSIPISKLKEPLKVLYSNNGEKPLTNYSADFINGSVDARRSPIKPEQVQWTDRPKFEASSQYKDHFVGATGRRPANYKPVLSYRKPSQEMLKLSTAREAFRGDFALPPKSCKPELRAYHNETGMDSATEYRDRYSHRN
ncbi:Oidioi.mRNA.OKI2018_I69.PAR.g13197.t1.cds [Oikopleura dioica]|uniref:Oidioi.mRNA.OKI2018_I69.PAR.g13197.t1.cds n=1 Tax=Oikopleura dioica TaxID=34765 RepID=A0ABN7S3L0_OIKDI|nr:Oidioi.mRNA.OKI2018_I69.PAR.g13197.t1.cds [Oikopleura dioica]